MEQITERDALVPLHPPQGSTITLGLQQQLEMQPLKEVEGVLVAMIGKQTDLRPRRRLRNQTIGGEEGTIGIRRGIGDKRHFLQFTFSNCSVHFYT